MEAPGQPRRNMLALAVLLFMSGFVGLWQSLRISELFSIRPAVITGVALAVLLYGAAILLLLYLRGSITFTFLDSVVRVRSEGADSEAIGTTLDTKLFRTIEQRIAQIVSTVEELKSAQLGALAGNREELIAARKPTLISDVALELEARFAAASVEAVRVAEIRASFETSHQRLKSELASLSRRSNLNLVIGVVTSSLAVALLAYMVLGIAEPFKSITDLLSHYIPRVTVVLFIEVFSFFFLRLYRATLAEIRLYQQDITALALRQVALETVWSAADANARATLAKELVASTIAVSAEGKAARDIAIDPDLVTDLLQKFAKVVLKKEKAA